MKPNQIFTSRLRQLIDYLLKNKLKESLAQQIIFFTNDGSAEEHFYNSYIFSEWPEVHHGFYYAGEIPVFKIDNNSKGNWITIPGNPVHKLADVCGQSPFRARTVWSALYFYSLSKEEFLQLFGSDGRNITSQELIIQRLRKFVQLKDQEFRSFYYERLRQLALFLRMQQEPKEKKTRLITMSDIYPGAKRKVTLEVLVWIFDFLPQFSEEWYMDSAANEPITGPAESSDSISCVCEYFNLDTRSFEQLFSVNGVLNEQSSLKDIGQNILAWLNARI
jgi:hypothetical protein